MMYTKEPTKQECCETFWNQARICYEKCGQTKDQEEKKKHLLEGMENL